MNSLFKLLLVTLIMVTFTSCFKKSFLKSLQANVDNNATNATMINITGNQTTNANVSSPNVEGLNNANKTQLPNGTNLNITNATESAPEGLEQDYWAVPLEAKNWNTNLTAINGSVADLGAIISSNANINADNARIVNSSIYFTGNASGPNNLTVEDSYVFFWNNSAAGNNYRVNNSQIGFFENTKASDNIWLTSSTFLLGGRAKGPTNAVFNSSSAYIFDNATSGKNFTAIDSDIWITENATIPESITFTNSIFHWKNIDINIENGTYTAANLTSFINSQANNTNRYSLDNNTQGNVQTELNTTNAVNTSAPVNGTN